MALCHDPCGAKYVERLYFQKNGYFELLLSNLFFH